MNDGVGGRAPRVLLVDDDEDSRLIYGAALRSAGFDVILAEDGESGLAAAQTRDPDVVLLDINMPGLDGREVLRRIRASEQMRGIPTIAVTAAASLHFRGDLDGLGFDAILLKPVGPELVAKAVRQILG